MKILLPIFLAAAFWLAGCNSVNTVERANPQAEPNLIAIKKVVTDPVLADIVEVVDVNEGVASGDLLKIQVELQNTTYAMQQYNYQFTWIEKDGFVVQSPVSPWRPGQVQGRETVYITAIAPNPRVVDFQVKLLARSSYNDGLRSVPTAAPASKRN